MLVMEGVRVCAESSAAPPSRTERLQKRSTDQKDQKQN
jgi:hypothetical protein